VEDFHWQQFVGKTGTFTMDGHSIFGNHDYDLKLDLTDESLGYIRAGYTEYRTWYDGTGGYYPLNNLSFQPYDNDLYVDRRNAWIEAGLTLPDSAIFHFPLRIRFPRGPDGFDLLGPDDAHPRRRPDQNRADVSGHR
jgi:hypothetical protein